MIFFPQGFHSLLVFLPQDFLIFFPRGFIEFPRPGFLLALSSLRVFIGFLPPEFFSIGFLTPGFYGFSYPKVSIGFLFEILFSQTSGKCNLN